MASEYASQWIMGMGREIEDQMKLETWTKVARKMVEEAGHFIIPLRWVYAYKLDEQGYVTRFKARLVVRGDQQPEDNEDTYAATLRARTFRVLMALCCLEDLETEQYDVKTAFLYNKLKHAIYCQMPPGYLEPGLCLKLLKGLYGLRIAPRLWFEELWLLQEAGRSTTRRRCLRDDL
ncbi:reverse transcriptase (RNA-dependent DNA polymerase) domain-containing protein [Hirsutella rhossiliensis]|uniref:Reverse transcriptase (RNA-dependent DNA polymerase) domain-containing protein n=1 Tax=Hirsutella rhossiliensis TaxID=111463 RepID=A0A9P8MP65_9HYPO|nr:reverse transcriptase (RNA-dependent DNA polymerase) domain-containing protein [Hirsutella rhossiliensis]KAH0958877.1 reverse transcriptase (RNA-dependent DNA polymerase) domain-containing protein [Hirsutella rhossiliensis]